ncbi:hypothetical protein Tco_0881679 [Tanacetum coccineum]
MSRSEPEEMALERSKPVVISKFDMHIYTSTLTLKELNQAIKEFFIPMDLRPRLPPSDLTMNKLLNDVIGIYIEQLDQGRMGIPFSTFLLVVISATVSLFRVLYKLCKQGHWFSFENKSGGRAKKCFKEITSSLKGWKKKFFLIDKRAIPKAMMWRHIDTDNLPDWNGTLVSKGNPIPDNERPPVRTITPLAVGSVIHDKNARQKSVEKPDQKIAEARKKKEKQTLFKANAKRAGEGSSVSLKKKRARKNAGPIGSESEGTVFSIVLAYLISLLYLVNMM